MKKQILFLITAIAILTLNACDSDNSVEPVLDSCNENTPCLDAHKTCINGLCIERCTQDSCGDRQYCQTNGVCADKRLKGESCSETQPCAAELKCNSNGFCIDENDQPSGPDTPSVVPCESPVDCPDNGLCLNNICIARCTDSSCKNGQLCSSTGLCVDAANLGDTCSDALPCHPNFVCLQNTCHEKPCGSDEECPNGFCIDGVCTPKCDDATNPCSGRLVCDNDGKCVEPCYAGICPSGYVCNSPKRICIPGECSWYDDCPSSTQLCDLESNTCIDKCTQGSCHDGTICGSDLRCIPGECSEIDVCKDNSKVCDIDAHLCIDKCTSNENCHDGFLCYDDGLCKPPCSTGSCEDGTVCGPKGICIPGECSDVDPCDISYKTCSNGKCIDKCKKRDDCAADEYCSTTSGLCIKACTATSCQKDYVCGEDGYCIKGACSALQPCDDGKVCAANHECVTPTTDNSDCYFYKDCTDACKCDENCDESQFPNKTEDKLSEAVAQCKETCLKTCASCKNASKSCPDNFQCNAFNQCIPKTESRKKGLGEACSLSSECDDDLACITKTTDKIGYCLSKAYIQDRQTCSETTFQNYCLGNIIVECVDGMIAVQDCKTYYVDLTAPTTGRFYGGNFSCVTRPNTAYVTCAQNCNDDEIGTEKFVCGWDIDDPEIEISDRFVCQYNEEGRSAFYPKDASYCAPTCGSDGKCE